MVKLIINNYISYKHANIQSTSTISSKRGFNTWSFLPVSFFWEKNIFL